MPSRLAGLVGWWRTGRTRRADRAGDRAADQALERASRRPPLTLLDLSEGPDPDADLRWRTTIRRRVGVVLACLLLWGVGIQARLVQLQVIRHDAYMVRAERQQQGVLRPQGKRGDIVDRHGRVLAYSVDAQSVIASPRAIEDPEGTVAALCEALGDCTSGERASLVETLSGDSAFAYVRRTLKVSAEQVQRVVDANLPGVSPSAGESRRWYPNLDLAAHVLGFVGYDGGLGGVEVKYDEEIRGREGVVLVQTDARQRNMAPVVEQAPTAGATLELTLDLNVQHIAERELKAGVLAVNGRGGTAIVQDPHTGEVLALANFPTFNPNSYNSAPSDHRRNRAIQDVYEPGSTFKIVTAAAALETGVIRPTDIVDVRPGFIKFPGRPPIEDIGSYAELTFEDVIVKSSNVGAIKVGLEVGAERLSQFSRRFGFGQMLLSDLQGASAGIVHPPATLNDSDLASMCMGYAVSVTALQMATGVSVIANGGRLMEPRFVRAVSRDGNREVVEPREFRRAVRPETASVLTTFMEGVVERGTGTRAALDRYQVAGKSGTAAKIIDGRYSKTDYNASFVGFVPSRSPVFTIVVVIDTPRGGSYYGGTVAAPIFKRIAEAVLLQAGVPPTIHPTPPVIVDDEAPAVVQLVRAPVLMPTLVRAGGPPVMPDVRGLSARAAVRVLGDLGLGVRLTGSGVVARQTPVAGQSIEPGAWSHLQLLPRPAGSKQKEGPR